jgi:hypothetical protein
MGQPDRRFTTAEMTRMVEWRESITHEQAAASQMRHAATKWQMRHAATKERNRLTLQRPHHHKHARDDGEADPEPSP